MDRCDARQRNLTQSLFELVITDYSVSGYLSSHLASWQFRVVGMVIGTSTVAQMPLPFPCGSDGDPTPRGVVGFVFLQALLCHFTYQHVKGHSY